MSVRKREQLQQRAGCSTRSPECPPFFVWPAANSKPAEADAAAAEDSAPVLEESQTAEADVEEEIPADTEPATASPDRFFDPAAYEDSPETGDSFETEEPSPEINNDSSFESEMDSPPESKDVAPLDFGDGEPALQATDRLAAAAADLCLPLLEACLFLPKEKHSFCCGNL